MPEPEAPAMIRTAAAIATYIAAKDLNRPWLMAHAFAPAALLDIVTKTDAIAFPATTAGAEAIADVLVRRFALDNENVYTLCLTAPPEGVAAQFACNWLVAMSRRADRAVRVGCGSYDWAFGADGRVERLAITIADMAVLPAEAAGPVMNWVSVLPWPWCPAPLAAASLPPLPALGDIARSIGAPS